MNVYSKLLLGCLLSQFALATASTQGVEDNEPRRCINLSRVDRTEVIDDRTIAFHMRNDEIYLNELAHVCNGLDSKSIFSYRTSGRQLCRVDMITVVEDTPFGFQRGASCSLGEFTPIDKEVLAILKGDEEEAELEVTEIPAEDNE